MTDPRSIVAQTIVDYMRSAEGARDLTPEEHAGRIARDLEDDGLLGLDRLQRIAHIARRSLAYDENEGDWRESVDSILHIATRGAEGYAWKTGEPDD